jgi:hypothetical protein
MLLNIHSTVSNFDTFLYELNSPHPLVRWVACYALGIIGNTDAIPELRSIAEQDKDFFIFLEYPNKLRFPGSHVTLAREGDNLNLPVIAEVSAAAVDAISMISKRNEHEKSEKGFYDSNILNYIVGGAVVKRVIKIRYEKGVNWGFWIGTL